MIMIMIIIIGGVLITTIIAMRIGLNVSSKMAVDKTTEGKRIFLCNVISLTPILLTTVVSACVKGWAGIMDLLICLGGIFVFSSPLLILHLATFNLLFNNDEEEKKV